MKVDVGHLKDVLMMDMLPSSIGVLTWDQNESKSGSGSRSGSGSGALYLNGGREGDGKSESGGEGGGEGAGTGTGEDFDDCRFFEPVLHKGDRIPSVGVRTFTLADAKQKTVSIDVYEEIEEYVLCAARTSTDMPGTLTGKEVSAIEVSKSTNKAVQVTAHSTAVTTRTPAVAVSEISKKEITYKYELIGTYDFIVPRTIERSSGSKIKNENPKIDVVFTMSAEGALVFSVRAHIPPKHHNKNNHKNGHNNNRDSNGNYDNDNYNGNDNDSNEYHNNDTDSGRYDMGEEIESSESKGMIWVLGFYLFLMFVLYVIVKILIQSPATKELIENLTVKMPVENLSVKIRPDL